jgi:peptidoglycan/LPS O-acetylase OafA/YrhL
MSVRDETYLASGAVSRRYVPQLDGLRAVACVLVLCSHAAPSGIFRGGFLGVDLFFVLSGYLITDLLAAQSDQLGKIDYGRFYLRRALRLTPALLLFLAAYIAIAPVIWPGERHIRDAALAALYMSDYSYPLSRNPYFIKHTWSLAVEAQFYLAWPVLLPLLLRQQAKYAILLAAWLMATSCRLWLSSDGWISYYFPLHTHLSGLLVGAGIAMAQRDKLLQVSGLVGTSAFIAFIVMSLAAVIEHSALAIAAAELAAGLIVGAITTSGDLKAIPALSSRPVIVLGRMSYGIYLWHYPAALFLREEYGGIASTIGTWTLALVGAGLSFHTVEAWGRRMQKAPLRPPRESVAEY